MKKSTLLSVILVASSIFSTAANKMIQAKPQQLSNVTVEKTMVKFKSTKKQTNSVSLQDLSKVTNVLKTKSISPKTDTPVAGYSIPDGLFHYGMTSEGGGYSVDVVYGPCFKDLTWKNTSTGATEYTWEYFDPTFEVQEELLTSNETDLTLQYPWTDWLPAPALTAINGNQSNKYDPYQTAIDNKGANAYPRDLGFYQFGGNDYSDVGITTTLMLHGAGFTSFMHIGYATNDDTDYNEDGESDFTNGTNVDLIERLFDSKSAQAKLTGFANYFQKPAASYAISKVWAWMNIEASQDTQLHVDIIKINDEGLLTDTIAFGDADIYAGSTSDSEGFVKYMPVFNLKTIDEFGMESEGPININSAILVSISGFSGNEAIQSCDMVCSKGYTFPYDGDDTVNPYDHNAYLVFDYTNTETSEEEQFISLVPFNYWLDNSTLLSVSDYMVMLDAQSWYLEADEYEYHFPNEGGSYDFDLYGHYPHALPDADGNEYYWSAEPVDPEADVDWLEISFESQVEFDPEANDDVYNGVTVATFTAEPLPEGVEGRSVDVKVSYPGAELVISLSQGVLGVKDVTVKSAQYVNVVGNDFVVKATSDVTKAEVYTAAGVKVAEAAVNGTATINAAGLAHGVYFVKLNNGKTVKVVK